MSEKVEIIEIDAGDSSRTLKDLKDEIKSLRQELDNCKVGSNAFKDTLDKLSNAQNELKNVTKTTNESLEGSYDALVTKMGDLKKAWRATADEAERADLGSQIAEINQQLKDMDAEIGNYQRNVGDYGKAFDGVTMKIEGGVARFEKFNNVSRSIIGSFDLVEGGLKAIGVESEEVNALMDTMQGAMMLTNGLNSVKEGVQAFNALRTSVTTATAAQTALNAVMMANPIGIIVAGVAALVAGITALVVVMGKNREEEKLLQQQFEATNKVIEDRISAQELEIQLMEARGEAQENILAQEKAYAETNLQTTKDRIALIEKELEDTGVMRFKKKKILREQLEDLKDTLKEQEQAVKNANNAILIYETKTQREQTENERTAAKERERIAKEEADNKLKEHERYCETLKTQYNNLLEQLRTYRMTAYEKEVDETAKKYEQDKQLLKDAYDNGIIKTNEEYYQKLLELREKFNYDMGMLQAEQIANEGNAAQVVADNTKKTTEETGDEVETLGDKLKSLTNVTDKQFDSITGGLNLMGSAFGQASQLLNTLAAQQDKTSEEGFEASKKMSIAAATMQMLQGVVAAWTSSMSLPMPIGAITAGIMTASTLAMGAVQIANIKKQTFEGADKGGGSATAPSVPPINTAALLSSPINYTTEVKGATAEESIMDTRVYVVESDITDTVKKVQTVESESTY